MYRVVLDHEEVVDVLKSLPAAQEYAADLIESEERRCYVAIYDGTGNCLQDYGPSNSWFWAPVARAIN